MDIFNNYSEKNKLYFFLLDFKALNFKLKFVSAEPLIWVGKNNNKLCRWISL